MSGKLMQTQISSGLYLALLASIGLVFGEYLFQEKGKSK